MKRELDQGQAGERLPAKRGRKASKETRRLQLIDATIDSLAKRGFSDTTMADVADGAGLSRGIVNFHFESKDKLLVATLQHMAEEYAGHWRAAVVPMSGKRKSKMIATAWWRPAGCGSWCWTPGLRRMAKRLPWKHREDNEVCPVRSKPEMLKMLTARAILVT